MREYPPTHKHTTPTHTHTYFNRQTSGEELLRIFRVGVLIVTSSSADVGWIPTVASKSAFVNPALIAIANP